MNKQSVHCCQYYAGIVTENLCVVCDQYLYISTNVEYYKKMHIKCKNV